MTEATPISRRHVLGGAAGLTAAALASGTPAAGSQAVSVPANGRAYARVPLRKDAVTVSAVQSRIRAVDGKAPAQGIRDNLAHMLELIDKVQFYGGVKDLLCFHEFPLQGWNPWDRADLERLASRFPAPETEAIAAKAKQYGCYIQFGAYARDRGLAGPCAQHHLHHRARRETRRQGLEGPQHRRRVPGLRARHDHGLQRARPLRRDVRRRRRGAGAPD